MRIERYVFFSETSMSQHHNVVLHHTHTHTLTNTLTLTHTHDWPTVASRSSGSRGVFSGFGKNFWGTTKWSAKHLLTARGHATSKNIFLRVYKMFHLFMYVFVCRHYAAEFKVVLGKLLNCKAQLLEINHAPTAR